MAIVGTVFFSALEDLGGDTGPLTTALPLVGALFVAAAALALFLPKTAVGEEETVVA